MLKLFMSAVGMSMLVQSGLASALPERFSQSRAQSTQRMGLPRVVGGCAMVGSGTALCGTGPTVIPSQLGANVGTAWATVSGMLIGGVTFAAIERVLQARTDAAAASADAAPDAVAPAAGGDEATKLLPLAVDDVAFLKGRAMGYQWLAVPCGIFLIGCSVALEFIVPHARDVAALGAGSLPWLPTVVGLIVGGNQLPIRLITGEGKGGSSALMAIIGTLSFGALAPKFRVNGFKRAWQFVFVYVGTTAGSLVSAQMSPETHSPEGFSIAKAMIGGTIMLFGARVAGGCTCGHGVSGFSELSVESLVAVPVIFGSAIATAFAVEALQWQ
jgi:uncharacterized membrane protein YedE/YeeE